MRGKKAPVRELKPDPVYGDVTVSKLINYVMIGGAKDIARAQVYAALERLGEVTKADPIVAFNQALTNIKPNIEVKAKRVGGSNYQVPTPVSERRQIILALRWVVEYSRKARKSKPYHFYLAQELADAFNNEGASVKKKEEVQRMADSNKAFSQFA
jgi:small subunit ribosomal protein S7